MTSPRTVHPPVHGRLARGRQARADPAATPHGGRRTAVGLARTASTGALAGALAGLVVGGVLGRLAMRLLATTSPSYAQGRLTDDGAVVGQVTAEGTFSLAAFTTLIGVVGGLIYLWVRRVLPRPRLARVLGYGLFAGSVGGALFVHDHPSFDYTVLEPTWLAVALFVALPLLFGLLVASLVEIAEGSGSVLRRTPTWLLVGLGAMVVLPVLPLVGPGLLAALALGLFPRLNLVWNSHLVTVVGSTLLVLMIVWGVYGIVADAVSMAQDTPSTAPLTL